MREATPNIRFSSERLARMHPRRSSINMKHNYNWNEIIKLSAPCIKREDDQSGGLYLGRWVGGDRGGVVWSLLFFC
jgi:hypothetical protein